MKINWTLTMTNRNVNPNVTYKVPHQYTGKPEAISITTLFEYFTEMLALENVSYVDNIEYWRETLLMAINSILYVNSGPF